MSDIPQIPERVHIDVDELQRNFRSALERESKLCLQLKWYQESLSKLLEAHYSRQLEECRERADFPPDRSDRATWCLYLLADGEISVGKAREWLREYIRDGIDGSLPVVNLSAVPVEIPS